MDNVKKMNKKAKIFLVLFCVLCFQMNSQTLKIMTYNIRLNLDSDGENSWTNRKDFFSSQMQFYEPDIFGVQEATPSQVTDISSLLPEYSYVGIGREGIGKGESSNVFYKKKHFSVLQENTFWLSETPDVISKGWDAACNRVCTYVLLKDKKNNKLFGFSIPI